MIGFEIESNLDSAHGDSHYRRGWYATSTAGTLGVAAACARLERAVDEAAGSPKHPLSWDGLADKYRDTASRVLDDGAVERSLEGFSALESARDVGSLIAELCPTGNGA